MITRSVVKSLIPRRHDVGISILNIKHKQRMRKCESEKNLWLGVFADRTRGLFRLVIQYITAGCHNQIYYTTLNTCYPLPSRDFYSCSACAVTLSFQTL